MNTELRIDQKVLCRVRPSQGTSFLLVGDQKAVFSELHQKIYALNDTAAFIWCHLQGDLGPDAICSAMVDSGIDICSATKFVRGAIQNWLRVGLLQPHYMPDPREWPVQSAIQFKAADYAAALRASDERLARILFPVFEHLRTEVDRPAEIISVIDIDGLIHVASGEKYLFCGSLQEVVPLVFGHVVDRTLERYGADPVLHCASLVRGDKALLLGGRSGAGKTTLTLRLAAAGFHYGGDDVAIISDSGIRGLPFPPGLKSGAWPLVAKFRGDLESFPIHQRYDRKRIRYATPRVIAADRVRPIGWFVFLRRDSESRASLAPITTMDAVTRVVRGVISPGRKLTLPMLSSIRRLVANAAVFELTYSELDDACEALSQLCHD